MATSITGYHISERLYQSDNSLVYRGRRQADDYPVILKMLRQPYPPPEKIAWFKREFEIIHNLNLPGVIKAYGLENNQHRWLMALEDFGGESLTRLNLAGRLALPDFLRLAIQISDILGQVHQQYVIHKDINPANIVAVPPAANGGSSDKAAAWRVKLIDFGIATVLSRETPTLRAPNILEGTLAYISPEQTGRMNRAIDYRTDFYSLGVTLYELLTGQPPFRGADPLEMIHNHIAKPPRPPRELKPDIPPALSEIILKLLAKNAEDRYLSAYGLKADLEECLRQWTSAGNIQSFAVGQYDFLPGRFQIPQKLYGRQPEIDTLLAAFERVTGSNLAEQPPPPCEVILVTGRAGIGKSALVQEVYKPITRQRGYFITGKFDLFKRSVPYASLIQAFQSLIRQLLTESESQIAGWRSKLLAALGNNGQVLIDVIPEIELIIGPQPEAPPLPPAEAQNRFNLTFQNFTRVFARREHPFVIFLDDLQWADAASLKLIQLLMTTPNLHYLFFIGAYRDNEVTPAHPLTLTLDEIKRADVIVNYITLSPLELPDITQLVSDTLNCPPEQAQSLAELLQAKTGGNPFFMNEFLKSLYTEELLTFIPVNGRVNGKCRWRWDVGQIQARGITDNVVDLMAGKMQKLPQKTQQVLKLAACIGNQFDLQTLSVVYQKPPTETAADLQEAIVEGLVLPLGEAHKLMSLADMPELTNELTVDYKFSHDRIQQAGYSLIPVQHKSGLHLQIGQMLLRQTPASQREEKIFGIVNQLNLGQELIANQAERDELARLNLMAGQKAKASAAYEPALEYLQLGLGLLNASGWDEGWTRCYDLALAMYQEAAEAAYLCTRFNQSEQFIEVVLSRAGTLLDKIKVYETKIQACIAQNKLSDAINTGLEVLALLDIHFPSDPTQDDIKSNLAEAQVALAGKSFEELTSLPEMTDPYKLPAMRILSGISALAFFTAPKLSPLISFKMVNLSVERGYAPESAFAYGSYAIMLGGIVGDLEASYQFGKLAIALLDRFASNEFKARTLVIVKGLVWHWKEHIKAVLAPLLDAYQIALDNGDLQYAAFAIRVYCSRAYLVAPHLPQLQQEIDRYAVAIGQLGQKAALQGNEVMQQAIANLIEPTPTPYDLIGNYYNQAEMLPIHLEANDRGATFAYYFYRLILSYLFEAYEPALNSAEMVEKYIDTAVGTPFVPVYHFYDSLARLALFDQSDSTQQKNILERVSTNQQKMQNWAQHAPMNYLHKYHLVQAELARVQGNHVEAREDYFQAISLARQNEYLQEEALAKELAARFYLACGEIELAHYYLHEARYAYQRWGAQAKVNQLEASIPNIFAPAAPEDTAASFLTVTTTNTSGRRATSTLDLTSVLKASQAFASEIMLDKLLVTLMKIAIENAGAQLGYLILERQGKWVVEAEGVLGSDDVAVLQAIPVAAHPLPMSIINYVVRTKEYVVLKDASRYGAFTRDPYILSKQPKSVLCAPLINQGQLTGMFYLENNLTTDAFTTERLTVLNLLSSQAAVSIENATLYTHLEESERKYRALFEDSNDVIFITSPEGRMLDMNPAGLQLFGYSREETMAMYAIDYYANKEDHRRFLQEIEKQGVVKDFELRLRKKNGAHIECLLTATIRRADDGSVLAYQGIVRDITNRKRAERERLQLSAIQRELTVAQEIQRSLLPPAHPNWAGPEVLCYSKPAREVGGDFYAYHAFDDNRYAIAVGDVSGKGTPAALVMGISLASFQALVGQRLAPGELLSKLDQTIVPYTGTTNQNCALVYAEITPVSGGEQGGILRVANAGCVMPIIRRASGAIEWIEVGGIPLGMGLGTRLGYQEGSLILARGDLVILISDGVVEAHNASEELFGFKQFEQVVANGPNHSPAAMLEHIKTAVNTFSGEIEANDDITIVVLQV